MGGWTTQLWIVWALFSRVWDASVLMTAAQWCSFFNLQVWALLRDQSIAIRASRSLLHANFHLFLMSISRLAFSHPGGAQGSVISLIVKAKCTAARTGQDQTPAPVTHRRGLSSHCLKRNTVCLSVCVCVRLQASKLLNVCMHVVGSGEWMLMCKGYNQTKVNLVICDDEQI